MVLVDTDVMVDVLRRYRPAVEWIESYVSEDVAIPGFVLLELIEGCEDKAAQAKVLNLVSNIRVVWLSEDACDRAAALFAEHRLPDGLGMIDALVAQTALEAGFALSTFNRKHYVCVPGLALVSPYDRT